MNAQKNNPEDDILCPCSGTTRGKIFDLFQQGLDLDAISQRTGIKTGCGGCDWDIEVFVRALEAQKS